MCPEMASKDRTKARVTTKEKPTKSTTTVSPPEWPPLQPLVPASDLAVETLLQDQIILIRNFFTSTLCKRYVAFLSSLPLVTTPAKPNDGHAVRVNDRIQFDDYTFAQKLWESTGLQNLLAGSAGADHQATFTAEYTQTLWGGQICGLNPRIRIYRYTAGQFFAQHCMWISSSGPFPNFILFFFF